MSDNRELESSVPPVPETAGVAPTVPLESAPPAYIDPGPVVYSELVPPTAPTPQPAPKRGFRGIAVVAAAIAGGIVGAALVGVLMIVVFGYPVSGADVESTSTETPAIEQPVSIVTSAEDAAFAEAVATKLTPSVVNVAIQQTGVDRVHGSPGDADRRQRQRCHHPEGRLHPHEQPRR